MYSYNKNKKKLNYMILIIMILVISIGYAILNTNLNIVGTGTINNPKWDIHWENVSVKNGSVTATTPTIDTAKTTVNYSVTLTVPGEYYEFTVDAVNAGTIDGMISVVSNKLNGTEITTLPNYLEYKVTYEDGADIVPNQILAANSSEKYKVHVGYKKDISTSDIPTTPQTLNLTFSITYVQKDHNVASFSQFVPVYTVNMYDSSKPNNNYISLNQVMPSGITQYDSFQDAILDFYNRPFYLKHKLADNVVTESYVEFIVTEEMANNNSEMATGKYTLRGVVDESETAEKTVYEANKKTLLNAFGNTYCDDDYIYKLECRTSDFTAEVYENGDCIVSDTNYGCRVQSDGESYCISLNG